LAIQAFSGGIQQLPTPDFNLSTDIAEGQLLVYRSATKSFDNFTSSFQTLDQVNTLIANIQVGGGVDLSNYVTTATLTSTTATLNSAIALKADSTYVDAQIAAIVHPPTDLSNYVTTASLAGTIANYDTSTIVTSKINTAVANATFFDGDYNNLFNTPVIPDLTGYATQVWVQGQIGTTDIGDLTDTGNLLGSGGATTLGALTDVSTTGVTTGQVLKYNGTSWAPAADDTSGGGGSNADTLDSQDGTWYLDWTNTTNKPTIPVDISDLTDTGSLLTHVTPFDGNYNSLSNKPTLFSGVYADLTSKPTLFDGAYASLTGKPTIPTDVSDLTDTTNLLSGSYANSDVDSHLNKNSAATSQILSWNGTDYAWVNNTGGGGGATSLGGLSDVSSTSPTTGYVLKWDGTEWGPAVDATTGSGGSNYATEAYVDQKLTERGPHFSGDYNDLTNSPTLFSGSFTDLNNKPTTIAGYGITDSPTSLLDLNISDGNSGQVLTTDGAGNFTFTSAGAFNGDYNALTNLPNLFSGNYNDLSNQPYIPSIAGLASTSYVDTKHAEAEILGDKSFTNNVSQVVKVSNVVAASHDQFVMSITTTNATPTEALLTTGNRIIIDDDSTVMYKVHIIASDSTSHYGTKIQGIINQTSGTLTLIGSQSTETLEETLTASTGTVLADTGNSSLKVLVTGEAAKNINWTIFVELNAVKR
jgi:hypothetical protein